MPRYASPNGVPIDRVLETVPCGAGIKDIAADGSSVEYDPSGSDVFWDDQRPVKRNGSFVFLDADGDEWTFDQLVLVEAYSEEDD